MSSVFVSLLFRLSPYVTFSRFTYARFPLLRRVFYFVVVVDRVSLCYTVRGFFVLKAFLLFTLAALLVTCELYSTHISLKFGFRYHFGALWERHYSRYSFSLSVMFVWQDDCFTLLLTGC